MRCLLAAALTLVALLAHAQDEHTWTELEAFVETPRKLLGGTEASVLRALGEPRSRKVELVENLHDETVLDELLYLEYPSITVTLWRSRINPHSALRTVVLTDARRHHLLDVRGHLRSHHAYRL